MTATLDHPREALAEWRAGRIGGLVSLLGEEPGRVRLERVHFPRRRPVQLHLSVSVGSGAQVPVLAEHVPGGAAEHAAHALASLRKSRNGQRAGLVGHPVVVDDARDLVLRRPGLDERLPGLRLLHEKDAARKAVERLTGGDPGTVAVALVAHRLGKRAVLRIETSRGTFFARLRALKSGDGEERLARHVAMWNALGPDAPLHVPRPVGALPALGLSLFQALPGRPPEFGREDAVAVARALAALRDLNLPDLSRHERADEAKLLQAWLARCRTHLPDLAQRIEPAIACVSDELNRTQATLRPSHRDLHEKQILVEDGVAGLLDFDTLSLADPALDAGNLLAHLFMTGRDEASLRSRLDLPGVALWRRAALLRLAMIHGFSSKPDAVIMRLVEEASR